MTTKTVLIFSVLALANCVSLYVAVAAWSSYKHVIELLQSHSTLSALELSASVTALQSSFESLSTTVRRLSSRYGMQANRAADGTRRVNGEIPLAELKGDEWRKAARAKFIRAGKATPHSEGA